MRIMETGERYSDGRDRTLLVAAPLYHMNVAQPCRRPCCTDHVVLQPVFEAKGFLQAITDHRVTRIAVFPSMDGAVAPASALRESICPA